MTPAPSPAPQDAPIVFLHGLFETPVIWDGLFARQGPLMPDHVALPLPGHCAAHSATRTAWLLENDRFLDLYARFLRQRFGGRPVRLVGHSTGGLVALRLAQRDPALVTDVFLVAALFCGAHVMQDRRVARLLQVPVLGDMSAQLIHRAALSRPEGFQAWCATTQAGDTPSPVPDPIRLSLLDCTPRSLAQVAIWVGAQKMPDRLPQITVPVTALVGTHDPVLPATHQLALLQRLPDARATLLETGHQPFFEAPRQFDRAFLGWRYATQRMADPHRQARPEPDG